VNKYILLTTGILAVFMGFFLYRSLMFQERWIIESEGARAALAAETIRNSFTSLMLQKKGSEIQKYMESIEVKGLDAVRLYGLDGGIVASSMPSKTGGKIMPMEGAGIRLKDIRMPLDNIGPCQRCHGKDKRTLGTLSVSMGEGKADNMIRALRKNTVYFYLIALALISTVLGLIAAIFINRPIREISDTMKRVEGGDMDARSVLATGGGIGSLGKGLNSMLSELQRMKKEQEEYHREEMRKVEKLATLGEIAAAIAHDIKNPLAGISGAIQVLSDEFAPNDPRREIIYEVLSEIERLDKSVKNLASFARPPEPHFIKTPLDALVERSVSLVSSLAARQGVDVNVVPQNGSAEVSVDPDQIQQVFYNIMLNAIQAMPGGGSLTIKTLVKTEQGRVEISFADTGQGIAEEDLDKIFKPFYSTRRTGTGLGLALCMNIMEKHYGKIIVDSKMGAGSDFLVILNLEGTNV
jgi:signal transduction histidine kinase